jgi:hypothetical protein
MKRCKGIISVSYVLSATLAALLFLQGTALYSQAPLGAEQLRYAEPSIPSAPAFSLLGVNPETVIRPSDMRSFKVDWRIKNYMLAPDLALEAQPLWYLYYKKLPASEQVRLGYVQRALASLNVSMGTAKIDGLNHASYAVKFNLYQQGASLSQMEEVRSQERTNQKAISRMANAIDSLSEAIALAQDTSAREDLRSALQDLQADLSQMYIDADATLETLMEQVQRANWNRAMVDVAFGSVYTYDNGAADIKVRRAGFGMWINGCTPLGQTGMLTGILRYTRIGEGGNTLLGGSYRYGNERYNFFGEFAYERLGNFFDPNLEDPFTQDEIFGDTYSVDLESGWFDFANQSKITRYILTVGGDFKLNRNILLNFALRYQLSDELKLNRMLPVANVICLMN